ncbi:hypothetical protein R84B8_02304 [Treponema sp. R8-4-B8]
MKKKMVLGIAAALLLLQAQMVFAADTNRDFNAAIREDNFSKAERILKNNAHKWSIKDQRDCWFMLSFYNNSTALRTAQLLYQYKVIFGDNDVDNFIVFEKSEELCRYLLSIGMPIGNNAIAMAVNKGYSDNFVQLLLEKGGTLNDWALRAAAKNKRWVLFPDLINKSTEDNINYRQTRDEYTAWYNSLSASFKQDVSFNYDPSESKTALMFAAQYGQFRIVRLLVEHGAKVNLRAEGGETAASLAYDNGEIDIYDYLKANGARDFEPRQVTQQPATPAPAPSQSTTNVYVQPSTPSQSTQSTNQSQSAGWNLSVMSGTNNIGGTWNSSVGNGFMVLNGNGSSGSVNIQANGKNSSGTATISGNSLHLYITDGQFKGQQFKYTIVTNKLIQGDGENFSRY